VRLMSLLDVLRQEYVKGRVVDKYRLENGNVGLVIAREGTNRRYHVQFQDDYRGPCIENMFGLLKEPFSGKTEYVDRLIHKGDYIELTASYSQGPFRDAYRVHSISRRESEDNPRRENMAAPYRLLYRSSRTHMYW